MSNKAEGGSRKAEGKTQYAKRGWAHFLLPPSAFLLCCAFGVFSANAQQYPAKPIRVVVPYPAGGTSDILTRMIGAKFTESWGQQVLADVRPGANGNIGVEIVARAAPDGYTL